MKIINENGINKLIPSKAGYYLLGKDELEKQPEERYYFPFAYLPPTLSLKNCEEKYIEIEYESEVDND